MPNDKYLNALVDCYKKAREFLTAKTYAEQYVQREELLAATVKVMELLEDETN